MKKKSIVLPGSHLGEGLPFGSNRQLTATFLPSAGNREEGEPLGRNGGQKTHFTEATGAADNDSRPSRRKFHMAGGQWWPDDMPKASALLALSASFGLVAGLVEGAGLYFLQASRWSGETIDCLLVPAGILYVSPLFDMALFVLLGFLAAGLCIVSRGRVSGKFILFLLLITLVFDWLAMALDRLMDPPYIAILSAGISMALLRRYWKNRERLVAAARGLFSVLAPAVVLLIVATRILSHGVTQAAATGLPRAPQASTNVLIVVMDTVRADHFSALGYSRSTTPNLDRLASQGVLFENAMSTSSWTLPAHASLLTGRYPFEHGAEVKTYDGRYPTLPEAFRARGYRTGAFSANTYYFAPPNGLGGGFLYFDGVFTNLGDMLMRTLYGRNLMMLYEAASHSDLPGRKRAELVNARFLNWLQRDSSRPFFAVLNYFDAHDPYLPPSPFRGRFADRPDVGGVLNGWGEREALKRPSDVRDEQEAYDGGIAYEDDRIGRLLETLKERGLAENTLLAVVSDHGEFFGEHGFYLHKNALFLEGIHVPLLLVWPGHVPSGVRVANPVSIAYLPATLMSLLPGRDRMEFPGPSLEPLWRGSESTDEEPLILSELVANTPSPEGGAPGRRESLLNSRWHFLYARGEAPQLFEWKNDPREEHNLAETRQGRGVVAGLMRCVQDHFSRIREPGCGLTAAQLNSPADDRLRPSPAPSAAGAAEDPLRSGPAGHRAARGALARVPLPEPVRPAQSDRDEGSGSQ